MPTASVGTLASSTSAMVASPSSEIRTASDRSRDAASRPSAPWTVMGPGKRTCRTVVRMFTSASVSSARATSTSPGAAAGSVAVRICAGSWAMIRPVSSAATSAELLVSAKTCDSVSARAS